MVTNILYTTCLTYLGYIITLQEGHYVVLGHITLLHDTQSFCYIACPTCYRQITAWPNQEFTCRYCRNKEVALPRPKFTMLIYDALTQFEVITFGEIAEMMLGLPVFEIALLQPVNTPSIIKSINRDLKTKHFLLRVHKRQASTSHRDIMYYNLISFNEDPTHPPATTTPVYPKATSSTSISELISPPTNGRS